MNTLSKCNANSLLKGSVYRIRNKNFSLKVAASFEQKKSYKDVSPNPSFTVLPNFFIEDGSFP
jgi:hypothetical protein